MDWRSYSKDKELSNNYTYNEVLNAKFLEIRESKEWRIYTNLIKHAKLIKRNCIKSLYLTEVSVDIEYRKKVWEIITLSSNEIKKYRKKRLDLLRKYGE